LVDRTCSATRRSDEHWRGSFEAAFRTISAHGVTRPVGFGVSAAYLIAPFSLFGQRELFPHRRMAKPKLRRLIAQEAARLILRGKEQEYGTARKRAARWLSRRKVGAEDLPTNAEIESQVYVLAGLFSTEHQRAQTASMRAAALELMELLAEFRPALYGAAVTGPVLEGTEIAIDLVAGSVQEVEAILTAAQLRSRVVPPDRNSCERLAASQPRIRLNYRYECELTVVVDPHTAPATSVPDASSPGSLRLNLEALRALSDQPVDEGNGGSPPQTAPEQDYHPDAFVIFTMLLHRLERVMFDSQQHPEGDVLYHSLQTYQLGLEHHPYDEEFLLACLLHDVGFGLDRRNPVPAALEALRSLVTERTCLLIERREVAGEYLRTGKISRALRRSEHFEDLLLLARLDRDARVPGTPVGTVEEALAYVAGLNSAWDDA